MKSTPIKIAGFTTDTRPLDKPAVCVFGMEGSGKTRFAATMPDPIGVIALDKKSRRTMNKMAQELGKVILINDHDYLSEEELAVVSTLDCEIADQKKQVMNIYTRVVEAVRADALRLARHKDVQSIVVDTFEQWWDWVMFSHFGRKNQIESYLRGPANQDAIDFINALKVKNLCLVSRAADEWKDTGEVDAKGRKKQAPSGKMKPGGFSKIGYYMAAVIETTTKLRVKSAEEKYHVNVRLCQSNSMLEGFPLDDYGLVGDEITWDNLMAVIGMSED